MNDVTKYRKKPVVIEAVLVPVLEVGSSIAIYVDEGINAARWCGGLSYLMVNADEKAFEDAIVTGPYIAIETLEGVMAARPGDYIIRGVQGEFYPCRADISAATYDQEAQ